MKKIVSILLCVALVLCLSVVAFAGGETFEPVASQVEIEDTSASADEITETSTPGELEMTYDELLAKYNELLDEHAKCPDEKKALQDQIDTLKAENATLKTENEQLKNNAPSVESKESVLTWVFLGTTVLALAAVVFLALKKKSK